MNKNLFRKNFANAITVLRIAFGVMLIFTKFFSVEFWVCYAVCGISDMTDGAAARALKTESAFGAKLDSIADFIFFSVLVLKIIGTGLSGFAILSTAVIAVIRVLGYFIGFIKFGEFSALHTLLNKAMGALIFAFPLLLALFGKPVSETVVCVVGLISAFEEMVIIIKSNKLDRNCKGILFS